MVLLVVLLVASGRLWHTTVTLIDMSGEQIAGREMR